MNERIISWRLLLVIPPSGITFYALTSFSLCWWPGRTGQLRMKGGDSGGESSGTREGSASHLSRTAGSHPKLFGLTILARCGNGSHDRIGMQMESTNFPTAPPAADFNVSGFTDLQFKLPAQLPDLHPSVWQRHLNMKTFDMLSAHRLVGYATPLLHPECCSKCSAEPPKDLNFFRHPVSRHRILRKSSTGKSKIQPICAAGHLLPLRNLRC